MIHALPILAQTVPLQSYTLSAWGWLIMILSVSFVTTLLTWCIYRVLRESTSEKVHSPVDIETGDEGE